jgi:hypothetical protein
MFPACFRLGSANKFAPAELRGNLKEDGFLGGRTENVLKLRNCNAWTTKAVEYRGLMREQRGWKEGLFGITIIAPICFDEAAHFGIHIAISQNRRRESVR